MGKRIAVSCAVVAILFALIALLPYPQKVEREFYGVNTISGEEATISLDMTYLRYLLRQDKLHGEITVLCGDKTTRYEDGVFQYIGFWPINNADQSFHYFVGWYIDYDKLPDVQMESVRAYLSKDFSKMMLYHDAESEEPNQYVANIDAGKVEETLKYFAEYAK